MKNRNNDPIPYTGKRKRHNPERREFRGISYKRGGERISDLRDIEPDVDSDAGEE